MSASNVTPWYADGLRFSCTQCGNCCTGPPGYVWFSPSEAKALAERFGMTVGQFRRTYAKRVHGDWSLNEVETEHGFDCVFLDRSDGRARCSVYEDRPLQCRTWPFWPENLRTPAAWAAVRRNTPCPGMGTGTRIPLEQIRVIRDRQAAES